jgi:hypothetical protein
VTNDKYKILNVLRFPAGFTQQRKPLEFDWCDVGKTLNKKIKSDFGGQQETGK